MVSGRVLSALGECLSGGVVESACFNTVAHEALLAGTVACAAGAKGAIVSFFRSFVELFHRNSVSCWLVCAAGARAVVASVRIGQRLYICSIIIKVAVCVKTRGRRTIAYIRPEESRGSRPRAV